MFVNVETLFFNPGLYADAVYFVKQFEGCKAQSEGPDYGDGDAEDLYAQKMSSSTVEQPVFRGKQTGHYCAENAAGAVMPTDITVRGFIIDSATGQLSEVI